MPNGLGAILAALAGGASGYVESQQKQRAEAIEADRIARLKQREDEDRKDREAARQLQAFALGREREAMGYQSEAALRAALSSAGSPDEYKLSDASYGGLGLGSVPSGLGLDSVPSGPGLATKERNAIPFLGGPPGQDTASLRLSGRPTLGANPFRTPEALEMVKDAGNTELRTDTTRKLSQMIDVPGGGKMYVPTADEAAQLAAKRRKVIADEATETTNAAVDRAANLAERDKEKARIELVGRLNNIPGLTDKQRSIIAAGGDINDIVVDANTAATLKQKEDEAKLRYGAEQRPKMTATQMKGYLKNEETVKLAKDVMAELQVAMEEKRNISGPLAQFRPGFLTMAEIPGTSYRPYNLKSQLLARKLQKIMNTELYDISGKAVTKTEMERAVGAMPGTGISEEMNLQSLQALIDHANFQNESMMPGGRPVQPNGSSAAKGRSPAALTQILKGKD